MMRFSPEHFSVSLSECKFCSVFHALLANDSSPEVKLSSEKSSEVKEFLEKRSTYCIYLFIQFLVTFVFDLSCALVSTLLLTSIGFFPNGK